MGKLQILKEGSYGQDDINRIKKDKFLKVIDLYASQLGELFEIRNPQLIFSESLEKEKKEFVKRKANQLRGDWVIYPWRNTIVHILSEEEYFELRTNRNRNLVTKEEQKKLRNTKIAFAGLSIGSSALEALVYSGMGRKFVVSDFDVLETSNLNRIKATLLDIGEKKLEIAIRRALEVDPYLEFIVYEKGVSEENCEDFLKERPNIIFEAIDSLKIKIILRQKARRYKIPIVMFTNLGDSVMIDIERYDLNQSTELFNGRVGKEVIEMILKDEITKENVNKYVLQLVGVENIPQAAIDSVKRIGKDLVGRPQLASTVGISGNLATYVAKKIILRENMQSGRFLFPFEKVFRNFKHDL